MLVVTFSIMGDVVMARALSRFGENVTDFTPVWWQIRENFAVIEEGQFESEGARGGAPWAQLSPSYAAWKEKHFPGLPILRLTTWLWGQLAVGPGLFVDITPRRLHMYPTVPYGKYLQQGTRFMPARKPVVLTEEDKIGWMKMIHGFVYDKAREARVL